MSFFRKTPVAPPVPSSSAPHAAPAISLEKVQEKAPGLVSLYKQAGVCLDKQGLLGQRAAVYLVLDRSGSMSGFYRNGSMQRLAEQALGLAANLDDDGQVPLVFFDSRAFAPATVDLSRYQGVVEQLNRSHGPMGGTRYSPALEAVIDHYQTDQPGVPALVLFQTDGDPADPERTEAILRTASKLPIFWQFIGFGRDLSFLSKLDRMGGRTVDNAGVFAADNPSGWSDEALYNALLSEYPRWLTAAQGRGIIR